MKDNVFFVYVYLDTRKQCDINVMGLNFKYKPFYVGKGKGNRHLAHLNEHEESTSNIHKYRTIRKIVKETGDIPEILKIKDNLDETAAFLLEKELINNLGITSLTNMTSGGSGGDTLSKHPNKKEIYKRSSTNTKLAWTKEKRLKLSLKYSGEGNPRYGVVISKELRKKMSESSKGQTAWNKGLTANNDNRVKSCSEKRKGQKLSKEAKRKMSEAKKGKYSGINNPRYIDLSDLEEEIILLRKKLLNVVEIAKSISDSYGIAVSRTPIQRILEKYNLYGRQALKELKNEVL